MNRFKNILYVTEYQDEEADALREACTLAVENGASLTIASIMPDLPRTLSAERLSKLQHDLLSVEKHRQGLVFRELLSPFKDQGLTIDHHVLSGIPFIEIVRDVLVKRRDLVVVPASPLFEDGRGFTSAVMHLMRKCPCPVWAIRTNHQTPFKRVLAAIDVGAESSINDALNADILQIATSEAKRSEAETCVVHAWNVEGERLLRGPLVELSNDDWEQLHEDTHALHYDKFWDALVGIENESDELVTQLVEGPAAELVPKCIEELEADLLIMGTLSRGGIEGYFMGHTSEEILQRTRCSVFAVKPASFTSPIVAVPAAKTHEPSLMESSA